MPDFSDDHNERCRPLGLVETSAGTELRSWSGWLHGVFLLSWYKLLSLQDIGHRETVSSNERTAVI